jgi:hypothetical protein
MRRLNAKKHGTNENFFQQRGVGSERAWRRMEVNRTGIFLCRFINSSLWLGLKVKIDIWQSRLTRVRLCSGGVDDDDDDVMRQLLIRLFQSMHVECGNIFAAPLTFCLVCVCVNASGPRLAADDAAATTRRRQKKV